MSKGRKRRSLVDIEDFFDYPSQRTPVVFSTFSHGDTQTLVLERKGFSPYEFFVRIVLAFLLIVVSPSVIALVFFQNNFVSVFAICALVYIIRLVFSDIRTRALVCSRSFYDREMYTIRRIFSDDFIARLNSCLASGDNVEYARARDFLISAARAEQESSTINEKIDTLDKAYGVYLAQSEEVSR